MKKSEPCQDKAKRDELATVVNNLRHIIELTHERRELVETETEILLLVDFRIRLTPILKTAETLLENMNENPQSNF